MEMELFSKFFRNPQSVLHPFTILPLLDQLILLITLLRKTPSKKLIYFGIAGIGVLFLMILVVGIVAKKWLIFVSALPFIFLAVYTIRVLKQKVNSSIIFHLPTFHK